VKEPLRYFQNAKEILRKAPIEDGRFAKVYPERSRRVKHVQEACGAAYLAVLKAIDESLLKTKVGVIHELPLPSQKNPKKILTSFLRCGINF
jgi:hypothetical protein